MPNTVHILEHALVEHHLTAIRSADLESSSFRAGVDRLATLLVAEATRNLATQDVQISTPIGPHSGHRLQGRIGLVPILRAGLGMVDAGLRLLPDSEVWHLGCYRDEETLRPVEYYQKFSEHPPVDTAFILDPMLATGGSAVAAVQSVRDWGVKHCVLLTIISAPEGIERLQKTEPDLPLYTCAIDEKLNDQAYIVPGLGDAGDRIYNT